MTTSLIYRNTALYEAVMKMLYGRHYQARYKAISDLIPDNSSVLDLCCGPAILYKRYLRYRNVRYTGVDINQSFIERLKQIGCEGLVMDIEAAESLPKADTIVMQASLYHFLPDANRMVDKMIRAAERQVIISEPVRNISSSNNPVVAKIGSVLTNPGSGSQPLRFTESTADALFSAYGAKLSRSFLIPGGREKVYILSAEGS